MAKADIQKTGVGLFLCIGKIMADIILTAIFQIFYVFHIMQNLPFGLIRGSNRIKTKFFLGT